jgi:hypothetical protein
LTQIKTNKIELNCDPDVRVYRWSIHRHTSLSFHFLHIGFFLVRLCWFSMLYIVSIYLQQLATVIASVMITRIHLIFRVSHLERSDLQIGLHAHTGLQENKSMHLSNKLMKKTRPFRSFSWEKTLSGPRLGLWLSWGCMVWVKDGCITLAYSPTLTPAEVEPDRIFVSGRTGSSSARSPLVYSSL